MIKQIDPSELPLAVEVIRTSFATVAKDLGLTEQNCPKYVGFVTSTERLQTQYDWGWWQYGLYDCNDAQCISAGETLSTSDNPLCKSSQATLSTSDNPLCKTPQATLHENCTQPATRPPLLGYVSISKEADGAYEINNLAVLPEHRHKGYGEQLLDFCITKITESGGNRVNISITEENTVLKNWYLSYGFIHTGTKRFEHLLFTVGYMKLEV